MNRRNTLTSISIYTLLISVFILTGSANAKQGIQIKDIYFPQSHTFENHQFELSGAGILTWGILVDLYAAALYTSRQEKREDQRLVIHYLIPIKATKIKQVAESFIRRQQGPEKLERMRPALDQLHNAMQDVKPGDRYVLTLKDNNRLVLEFNDSEVITLNDPLLAEAYLNIWLGKDPIDKSLKISLLGQT
ncbi:hypothetical protein A3195_11380 [Candidatus Thiodiazotropha endoloripes]|uniref:chalcone isomerase family protein n=1 Tax=Candidatus Thiodiazotropha endoloripes TaxID=1818881 RepID=UPI00083CFCA4|nr:chalcone isomerase family protein [Candidatus Thiodiazotropha endoloripes]MCG7902125.1 chalcone isomerase family protein [Candidatus Thiodiazotropha weberae]MCG7914004.1 chalcone isomerase family protein [Candidatus Thiodiazotropha weberae]ODB86234.1 hypothetical protein A3195_11380 [Candidatus Thiodiazotropha endoloripes]ODB89715.1 hypothetical protein A3194_11245 [Candidatus Thiodiazotropha endoloripes]